MTKEYVSKYAVEKCMDTIMNMLEITMKNIKEIRQLMMMAETIELPTEGEEDCT
ncbi:MAG: hypothetical protein J6S14_11890 [Clostridia bacterium]|nr:hypothetical protein [Clostridia bacterium]